MLPDRFASLLLFPSPATRVQAANIYPDARTRPVFDDAACLPVPARLSSAEGECLIDSAHAFALAEEMLMRPRFIVSCGISARDHRAQREKSPATAPASGRRVGLQRVDRLSFPYALMTPSPLIAQSFMPDGKWA